MKTHKIILKQRIQAIILLFSLCISTGIMSMARVQSLQTPEQKRALAARQAAFQKMQQKKNS